MRRMDLERIRSPCREQVEASEPKIEQHFHCIEYTARLESSNAARQTLLSGYFT
jgi:hypothetical protein